MPAQLNKLTIKGFKSIRSLENFELGNLNVLIGGNGAGKSNFIDFFRMMAAMMKPDGLKAFVAGNADAFLFGGPKATEQIEVRTSFGQNGYDFDLAPTEDGFFLINNEARHYFPNDATRNFGSGNFNPCLLDDKNSSSLRGDTKGASWHTYEFITSWRIYHFHDTTKEAKIRRYQDMNHSGALTMDGSNIAPFLYSLKKNNHPVYQDIINNIRIVLPFFDDFILEPKGDEKIRLDWRQKGLNDFPMRPSQLSDGAIRFIALSVALLQPNLPSTIIIDEPELGLHPHAIEILAEMIQTASQKTQVIISTQSPALVDLFKPEDIIVVNREDGATTFNRLPEKGLEHWLEDYSLGDLWRKDIVAGGPVHE